MKKLNLTKVPTAKEWAGGTGASWSSELSCDSPDWAGGNVQGTLSTNYTMAHTFSLAYQAPAVCMAWCGGRPRYQGNITSSVPSRAGHVAEKQGAHRGQCLVCWVRSGAPWGPRRQTALAWAKGVIGERFPKQVWFALSSKA